MPASRKPSTAHKTPSMHVPELGQGLPAQILNAIEASQGDPDFMTSLARGMAVLHCFNGRHRALNMSQISQSTGLPRASIRRVLHTLTRLGYVAQEGQGYALLPRVLGIGNAYLSSATHIAVAQPILDGLRDRVHESCSMGVLDVDQVLYVARAETMRIMSVSLRPGSRIPAYCSSMGRVLLASLSQAGLKNYLARVDLHPYNERTIIDATQLRSVLDEVRRSGFCIVDQELELGLRSIAVPVHNPDGEVIGAFNIGTQSARVTLSMLKSELLPELRRAAEAFEARFS
jgi:IclR family transcriptional regulator, pca regulon regulatory protein